MLVARVRDWLNGVEGKAAFCLFLILDIKYSYLKNFPTNVRTTAQMISYWLLTIEAWVQIQGCPCGICH
jgi:hypothetical protein